MQKTSSSWRVPRVFHLQYLTDFLSSINSGLEGAKLESKIAERKQFFENEKYKILGRGHPLMKNLSTARNLLHECFTIAYDLDFLNESNGHTLTADGKLYLSLEGIRRLDFFANRFLATYKAARNVLLVLSSQPNHEILIPTQHVRSIGDRFEEVGRSLGILTDVVSFIAVRDLLSQAALINWQPVPGSLPPKWLVYDCCSLSKKSNDSEKNNVISFVDEGETYFLARNACTYDDFRRVLWHEYLERTRHIPMRPVFYSELRAAVCRRLRLSDHAFDEFAKHLLEGNDDKYNVFSATGSLPYTRDFASLLKSLPPKSSDGRHIVYLKIERGERQTD
jgi:hypothetical protein